jgi:short subunit dehydrogenase-like uncharacterized protein
MLALTGHANRRSHMQALVTDKLTAESLPQPNGVLEVDNNDEAGLRTALSTTRVCLNCTGPYRFLGEPVVAASIGTCHKLT